MSRFTSGGQYHGGWSNARSRARQVSTGSRETTMAYPHPCDVCTNIPFLDDPKSVLTISVERRLDDTEWVLGTGPGINPPSSGYYVREHEAGSPWSGPFATADEAWKTQAQAHHSGACSKVGQD